MITAAARQLPFASSCPATNLGDTVLSRDPVIRLRLAAMWGRLGGYHCLTHSPRTVVLVVTIARRIRPLTVVLVVTTARRIRPLTVVSTSIHQYPPGRFCRLRGRAEFAGGDDDRHRGDLRATQRHQTRRCLAEKSSQWLRLAERFSPRHYFAVGSQGTPATAAIRQNPARWLPCRSRHFPPPPSHITASPRTPLPLLPFSSVS